MKYIKALYIRTMHYQEITMPCLDTLSSNHYSCLDTLSSNHYSCLDTLSSNHYSCLDTLSSNHYAMFRYIIK